MAASICAPRYRFPPMSLSPRQDGQLFCTERRTEQSPAYWRGGKLCFFQAHCVAVAGLEMAEGRVCEKWNRIPLALFNLNLKGTFHLLCAAAAGWDAQGGFISIGTRPLKGRLVLILHCVALLIGQSRLLALRWGSRSGKPSLPVSISEHGVNLHSTRRWAVVKVSRSPSICVCPGTENTVSCVQLLLLVRIYAELSGSSAAGHKVLVGISCLNACVSGSPTTELNCVRLSVYQVVWSKLDWHIYVFLKEQFLCRVM